MEFDEGNDNEDKLLSEEYKIWKKNAPFLYDFILTQALEWPSLTVQWLPEVIKPEGKEYSLHKMILGTHTSNEEPNYLMLADVAVPLPDTTLDARKYDDERGEVGGFGGTLSKIDIKIKIIHDGEVHRARYMPQNNFVVATKSPTSNVYVFDYTKHSSIPTDKTFRPQHRCLGHDREGYGLNWNPHVEGQLLSGSDDSKVCLWDVREAALEVSPLQTRVGHTAVVEDVDWHKQFSYVFASVGDDSRLLLWDTRQNSNTPIHSVENAHKGDVNCVAFNPFSEFMLATGGGDNVVNLWDMRNLKHREHTLEGHEGAIYQVNWAPFNKSLLGTCGADRRVNVWDLARIGDEQDPEDAADGPPELLFVHAGHTAKVSEFSWNRSEDNNWVIASVADDNILHVWQMSEDIRNPDEEQQEEEEDEDFEVTSESGIDNLETVTKKPRL